MNVAGSAEQKAAMAALNKAKAYQSSSGQKMGASQLDAAYKSSLGGLGPQVTSMDKFYNDYKAANNGSLPNASQVSQALESYKNYVAGKTTDDDKVWNQYGEVIGRSADGRGYTDFSHHAANATVDPNRIWDRKATDTQRALTGTPLRGTYLDYETGQWGKAPASLQKGGKAFLDHSRIPAMAKTWLAANPDSLWDEKSLGELWMGQYEDISKIPQYFDQYANEFKYSGKAPTVDPPQQIIQAPQLPKAAQPGMVQAPKAVTSAPVSASNTSGQTPSGTVTAVLLPDGRTVSGYINNGITSLADGTRVPVGSTVQTAGGTFMLTDNGSIPVSGLNDNALPIAQTGTGANDLMSLLQGLIKQTPSYDMSMYDTAIPEMRDILNYSQATRQARNLYGSQFKEQREDTLNSLQADLIRRGLFGQLDASALEQSTSAQLLDAENTAIAQLAQQLMERDQQSAYQQQQQALQQLEYLNGLRQSAYGNALTQQQNQIANIMAILNLTSQQEQTDWQRALQEAQLTGTYNGQPIYTGPNADLERQLLQAQIAETQRSANMPYRSSSDTSKPTATEQKSALTQQALSWINTYKDRFTGTYPAKNMYEQVKRNIAAGTMDANLGYEVLKQLENLYME